MGSRRVAHEWATSLSLFTFLHWRRKWQPTPVFLPRESQGRRGLVGCRLWRRTESWILIGRTDVEAETPILWPPGVKNWPIWEDPDAGKVWGQEEKGTTEDEMVGWHHWLKGHEFEQASGDSEGWGSLACCSPWGHKESDMTEWLNWLLLSCFSRVQLCATPQLEAHQALPSLGFSRQEDWSGLPFPPPMQESEKWKGSPSVVSDS